jgi:hypothetical protein
MENEDCWELRHLPTLNRGSVTQRRTWSSTPRSAVVADPLTRTSPSHVGSSRSAASLDHVLAKVISDVERLESMLALQRGMISQRSAFDAARLRRQTERFAEGIEATSANLRQALSELRRIEGETRSERGKPAPRP